MESMDKITTFLNRFLISCAGAILIFMIILTCANVFLRFVFGPIKGTVELIAYSGAIITSFALGYTQLHKGHITVDFLFVKFPVKVKSFLEISTNFICMVFFLIVALRLLQYGISLWRWGETTETLKISFYPFVYAVSFGCVILSLTCATELLKVWRAKDKN